MRYSNLGKSGLKVSNYCIGSDSFGAAATAEESLRILATAFDSGVNFIDTADVYADNRAEEIIGRFIQSRRSEAVINSKGHIRSGELPNDAGSHRKHIFEAIEGSLKRLGTDYIDTYMLHYYDYETPLEESIEVLEALVRSGKVLYVGCSNFWGSQLTESLWIAERRGFHKMAVTQTRYNLLNREPENELFPACAEFGVGVMAFSPQAGGFLLGKHRNFSAAAGSRIADDSKDKNFYRNAYWNAWCFRELEKLMEIPAKYNISANALALQWVLRNPVITACVVGARNIEQITSNLSAWNEQVPEAAFKEAEQISDALKRESPWRGIRDQASANADT